MERPTQPTRHRSSRRSSTQWDDKIERLIRGKSREELVEEVLSLVGRFPELREEYRERISLTEGDVDRLVAQARRELRDRTSETGWRNHWDDEGHTPDYSRLKHRLERMVELGHSDVVVPLGREFIERAMDQVGESHDEGETAMAVGECMPVVFDAVMKSTLPGPQRILFAIDACLKDGYDVLDESVGAVLDAPWKPADWSVVADEFARRLEKMPAAGGGDSWHHKYERDQVSGWLLRALENAGREDELLAIYESEARTTGSYERLVGYLIAEKRFDDAERWAKEGIEKTREKLPGIASSLAASLCELSRGRKQWDVVAAHAACQFFERPGKETFDELMARAVKAKCARRCVPRRFVSWRPAPRPFGGSRRRSRVRSFASIRRGRFRCRIISPRCCVGAVGRTRRASRTTMYCSTWPSPPSSRTRSSAGMTSCRRGRNAWVADGVGPRAEQRTAWLRQLPSPIPNGPWKSIGGSWVQPCQEPTSPPTKRRRDISRSFNR